MAPLFSATNIASVVGVFAIFCASAEAFRPLSNDKWLYLKRPEDPAKVVEDEQ